MHRTLLLLFITLAWCGCAMRNAFMSRDQLLAESKRDTTAVIVNDTMFFAGAPMYRAFVPEVQTIPLRLKTFAGKEIFSITSAHDVGGGTYNYYVMFPTVGSHFEMTFPSDDQLAVINTFLRRRILTRDAVGIAELDRLLSASGASTVAEQQREDSISAERSSHIHPAPMPPGSFGSSGSSREAPASRSGSSKEVKNGWVRVHNRCRETVWISVTSESGGGAIEYINCTGNSWGASFSWGKRICVLDDRRNPISCVTTAQGVSTVEIGTDGRSIGPE